MDTEKTKNLTSRKSEHLKIVLEENVAHSQSNLLDNIQLLHQALPEIDYAQIKSESKFLGRTIDYPLMITGMTGGAEYSEKINHALAQIANRYRIPFSVGSQRIMLKHPETIGHFKIRKQIPDSVLLGNIGAPQIKQYGIDKIMELFESIDADGICVHLNPAQELIQTNGERDFTGQLDSIKGLVDATDGRVLVKETGAGMSPDTILKLYKAGVKYIDIAGSGGTSWTKVESYRGDSEMLKKTGKTFADWGIPTAVSIIAARNIVPDDVCLIASGGIETGLDSARAIAAGADISGFARHILVKYFESGEEGAVEFLENHIYELKSAMLLTGSTKIKELQNCQKIFTDKLRYWLDDMGYLKKDR